MISDAFQELSFHLGRVYFDHLRVIELLIEEEGLDGTIAASMGQILFALRQQDGGIIKDLVGSLHLSPARLTALLGKMEESGLVRRATDAADARAVRVFLTPAGRRMEERCRSILAEVNAVLAEGMSATDIDRLKRGFAQMTANLARRRAAAMP